MNHPFIAKKSVIAVALASAFAFGLVACGGGSSSP